jgi:hypothetical protein
MAASTYFVEAFAYMHEDIAFKNTVRVKVAWIVGSSLLLGCLLVVESVQRSYEE